MILVVREKSKNVSGEEVFDKNDSINVASQEDDPNLLSLYLGISQTVHNTPESDHV